MQTKDRTFHGPASLQFLAMFLRNLRAGAFQAPVFICAPGRAHLLGGASPLHTRHGEVLAEGKGVLGDWESEGSSRQSAGATNRKRIEAAWWDERAKVREVRYVYGTRRRRSDAHKREGGCAIPGEI